MDLLRILLVIMIVCAAIFVITYVAYNKKEDSTGDDCDNCSGDCLHCGRMPQNKEK